MKNKNYLLYNISTEKFCKNKSDNQSFSFNTPIDNLTLNDVKLKVNADFNTTKDNEQ